MAKSTIPENSGRPWREVLKIHPAAEVFPLLPEDELRELGEDIKAHGLETPITMWLPGPYRPVGTNHLGEMELLDGRSRLDACELVGLPTFDAEGKPSGFLRFSYRFEEGRPEATLHPTLWIADPYDAVISLNIRRRHLTPEQRREAIAKVTAMRPELSDRQIANKFNVDHKTVGAVRKNREATGEISPVERRIGADGKSRPVKRSAPAGGQRPTARENIARAAGLSPQERETLTQMAGRRPDMKAS